MDSEHTPANTESIAGRTVQGSLYSVLASGLTLTLGFIRSILLARLLLPEHFGVVALALFFLNLSASLRNLGLDQALIHRQETDENTFGTYFSLRLGLSAGSLLILAALTPLIARAYPALDLLDQVLIVLIGIGLISSLTGVQETILRKNLAFRQIAITDVLSSITMTIIAPYLAWRGWGVWSLVAEQASGALMRMLAAWVLFRPWRPQLRWDSQTIRWFWWYGVEMWKSGNLVYLLNRFDDFWVGSTLGGISLGFYSRAYEFARYSRRVIANPLLSVFFPSFARLQDDRLGLSRAFFRVTSLVLRVGYWFSLVFILAAPEFIELVIGSKWLPMQRTFQLMVLYTLLDPLAMAASNLLMAIGQPALIVRTRTIQLALFIPAVMLFARFWGIDGVALAADLMVLTGAIMLFRDIGRFVTYSNRALWLWPNIALIIAAGVILVGFPLMRSESLLGNLVLKSGLITLVYWGVLMVTERHQLMKGWQMVWSLLRPSFKSM